MRDSFQPGSDKAIDLPLSQRFTNSFESFFILDMNEHFSFSISAGQGSTGTIRKVDPRRPAHMAAFLPFAQSPVYDAFYRGGPFGHAWQ
jgi:hypothetical protein